RLRARVAARSPGPRHREGGGGIVALANHGGAVPERLDRHLERQRRGGPQLRYVPADGSWPEDRYADGNLAPQTNPRARGRLHPPRHPAALRNSQQALLPPPRSRGGEQNQAQPRFCTISWHLIDVWLARRSNNLRPERIDREGGMTEVSDAELLTRFRGGDDSALEALFERHELPLFYFLLGMLRDTHHAGDALQETVVRALERLDGVDPDHLRGWLFTVAYHQAMLLKRRGIPRQRLAVRTDGAQTDGLADPLPGPLVQAEREDDARRLRQL